MKKLILIIAAISLLTNCMELVPEPDKVLREEYEKQEESGASCLFSTPDTSVSGIKIRDMESVLKVLGKQTKLEGDMAHTFYSIDKRQKLVLKVHPGDYYNNVSIFNISYSKTSMENLRRLNSKEFETEKGIKLGISKKKIIEIFGSCYLAEDSTKNSITLNYKLELDSTTSFLSRNNMPVYYARYKLLNENLREIEFGFDYP